MKTTFDTDSVRDYEFTHGHKPRGTGSWAFDLGRNGAWTIIFLDGSFTDAKKAAMREARALGCETVRVGS